MKMSSLPLKGGSVSSQDNALAFHLHNSSDVGTDPMNRDRYDTTVIAEKPHQSSPQKRRDPDGDYFDCRPLFSNLNVESRCSSAFTDGIGSSMSVEDATGSSQSATSTSKILSSIFDPDSTKDTFTAPMANFGSRSAMHHETFQRTDANFQDKFLVEQDRLAAYHAAKYDCGISTDSTDTTTKREHSYLGRVLHRYESNCDDVYLTHEDHSFEFDSARVHRLEQSNAAFGSRGVSAGRLSEFDMRIRNKCDIETTIGPVTQKSIAIAYGQDIRFRGAAETWKAIRDDYYLPCSCVCCNLMLFCIQDASYVLCPVCFDISPIEHIETPDGGIGLGFTMTELSEWQKEIVSRQGR